MIWGLAKLSLMSTWSRKKRRPNKYFKFIAFSVDGKGVIVHLAVIFTVTLDSIFCRDGDYLHCKINSEMFVHSLSRIKHFLDRSFFNSIA